MAKREGQHSLNPKTVELARKITTSIKAEVPDTKVTDEDRQLQALLRKHLIQEFKEEEESRAQATENREQRIRKVQKTLDDIEEHRDNCSHRKPNQQTALGGQRNFDGKYRFVCSICNRTFTHPAEGKDEHAVPPDLLPPSERIGSSMGF